MSKLNVGDESVVLGNVSGNIGKRCVVVGATDANGDTIFNKPMSIGNCANGGDSGVAIGV